MSSPRDQTNPPESLDDSDHPEESGLPGQPHDAVFRYVLGEPVNAASQLRAVLPPALVAHLDLDRLEPVSGSFIDDTLRSRQTDLLFTAPITEDGSDGERLAYVYVLVEHQSSSDPLMAYRMLRYLVRIWDGYLRDHPGVSRLPPIIPLVVHHNRTRAWTGSTQLLDLIDLNDGQVADAIRDYLPSLRFILDDLNLVDEQELRDRHLTPAVLVTLWLLKTVPGNAHLDQILARWRTDLQAALTQPGGTRLMTVWLRYIWATGETPVAGLYDLVTTLGPEAQEAYVTTAEMLRAEGRAEGEARGRAETLGQLLDLKFGPLPQDVLDRLDTATTDQLTTWTERFVTADTLNDILG